MIVKALPPKNLEEIKPGTLVQDDHIACDGCDALLLYLNASYTTQQIIDAQCLPVICKDFEGKTTELHFCSPCMKHQPEKVKAALERLFEQQAEREKFRRLGDISLLHHEKENVERERDELKAKNDQLQNDLKKTDIVNKQIRTTLEALELKLGKLNAEDFSARFREPVFVVLLEEGEDIIRRFLAGPPGSEEEIKVFTEKLNKWLNSAKKARESTTTHRQLKAGESLRNAFQKSTGGKKPE